MMDRPLLISGIIEHAATVSAGTEIVARRIDGSTHRYGYAEAARRCRQLANAIVRLSIADGDVVGSLAWNTHQHFELFYGISGTGAVLHTINPRLFDDQIVYIVNHAEDRWLFLDATTLPLAERLAPQLETVRGWIYMGAPGELPDSALPGLLSYEDLLAAEGDDYDWPEFDERKASTICYTSGTTGQPKGVVNTHRSTILSTLYMSTADMIGGYAAGATDTVMPIAPMFHGNGWQMVYTAPAQGQRMVLPGRNFEPEKLYEQMVAERVTLAAGVPTIWLALVDLLKRERLPMPPTLRVALTAGTKAPPSLLRTLREEYGLGCRQTWGMTEALGVTKASPPPGSADAAPEVQEALSLRQGRMGFLAELRLVDDQGRPVPHDGESQGHLQARGPCVAAGYLKQDPVAVDGWLPTGDIARIHADGSVEIVDRAKDVIKSGGEWIPSVQVEAAAMDHPDVAQAAVIGVPHPKWQERPLLLVVPRAGAAQDADAIRAHLAGRIAKWWIPEEIRFVDELPMTATGKIHKVTLRERYGDPLKAAE
ncbi:long-chain fatty acid--CoA ligase [Marinibaculum pumilum]|uniref:Long-chain fatty acid--CoA ligase n=1 Tax=Marinibaculum pumilum TaxID=1766165 RepID=A0ABV7L274_9PROT